MLIVLTQDKKVIDWANDKDSGSPKWGKVCIVNEGGAPTASVKLKAFLKLIKKDEPLCITGHGTDKEIGDIELSGPQSWFWGIEEFAGYLEETLPQGYTGPILVEACAETSNNFSAGVAEELGKLKALGGVWVYGYDYGVAVTHPFPDPDKLADNDELTKDQVDAGASAGTLLSKKPKPKTFPPVPFGKVNVAQAKYNQPAEKFYVVNETGNIMLATTQDQISKVDPTEQGLFKEVAVFFAAMTKAITNTLRPGAKEPYTLSDYYTIYDYVALENIVNRSGLFVNVHREDLTYSSTANTVAINVEFIERVLGVVLTDGVGAGALMASLRAMGKQATFSYNSTGKYQKIGNLLFLCEDLFGMPIVNILYFYLDEKDVETVVSLGPCIHVSESAIDLKIHKDTFLFVPPSWIEKYAGDLAAVPKPRTTSCW